MPFDVLLLINNMFMFVTTLYITYQIEVNNFVFYINTVFENKMVFPTVFIATWLP